MTPTSILKPFKLTGLLFLSVSLFAAAPPASYMRSGVTAYQGRRWVEAMAYFLQVLSEDPRNADAQTYLTRISQHIDEERIALVNDTRMDMMTRTAQRLDVARMETKPVDEAIDETKSKAVREQEEQRHASCILARKEQSLGHLESANDLVLGVLREDPNNAEAQRILSDLQSGLHESLTTRHDMSAAQELALKGFYAYGQADYRAALESWKQARVELAKEVPPEELDHRLSLFHFDKYQKVSQDYVDKEGRQSREQERFEQGGILFDQGQRAEAYPYFREIALVNPGYPQLARYLAESRVAVEEARTRSLSLAQRDRAAHVYLQGLAFLDDDKLVEAKKAFADVLTLDRSHPQANAYSAYCQAQLEHRQDLEASQRHYEAGLIAYASGNAEESAREWRVAQRLDPGNLKAVIALAKVKKEMAQVEDLGL